MRIKYNYYPGCCHTQVNLFPFFSLFFLQGAVGPNGMLGWEEIQNLADALFQQRDSIDLIESCVDKLIKYIYFWSHDEFQIACTL